MYKIAIILFLHLDDIIFLYKKANLHILIRLEILLLYLTAILTKRNFTNYF